MKSAAEITFRFADIIVDVEQRRVFKGGKERKLRTQAFEVLIYLLENPGRLISREELVDKVWERSWVDKTSLPHCISEIRRAIDDRVDSPVFIETVPKRGYRFIGQPVKTSQGEPPHVGRPVERWHLLLSGLLYALLYVVALLLETAYEWPEHRTVVGAAGPLVFLFTFAGAAWAYNRLGADSPMLANWAKGLLVFFGSAVLVTFVVAILLPDRAVTLAYIPTQNARIAYWKNMQYFLLLGLCFQMLPIGLVAYLGAKSGVGRHLNRLSAITRRGNSVNPIGLSLLLAICVCPFLLFVILLPSTYFGLDNLRSNLIEAAHSARFEFLLWVRWGLFIVLVVEALAWFYWRLLELASEEGAL